MRRRILGGYLGLTGALAVGVLAAGLAAPAHHGAWAWWGVVVLFVAAAVSETLAVPIPSTSGDGEYVVSIATIPHIAAALLVPPPLAAGLAGLAMLVDELRDRRPPERVLFNVASTTTSVGLTALAAQQVGLAGDQFGTGGWLQVIAFLGVASGYYLINTILVCGVGAISSGQSFGAVLVRNARFTAPAELAIAVIGGLAAFMWVKNPFWLPVGLFPVVISQLTFRYIAASNRKASQLAALDKLGRALAASVTAEEVFHAGSSHLRGGRSVEGTFLHLLTSQIDLAEGLAQGAATAPFRSQLTASAVAAGAPVCVGDATHELATADGCPAGRSWVALPLGGDEIRGCFGVIAARPHAFSQEDLDFFRLVADRMGAALENARRAAELITVEAEQRVLRHSEERFRSLIYNAADVIVILDSRGTMGYQSPAAGRVWGYPPGALTGTSIYALIHPEDLAVAQRLLGQVIEQPETTLTRELRLRHADGSWRHFEIIVNNLLADAGVGGIVATCRDITERRAFESQLSHLAFHDALTGLPNRALFLDRLQHALRRADRQGGRVGVLFLDLDNFKVVNDSLGHEAGDRVLVEVAGRLTASLRATDTVARLGGDEFTVLVEDGAQEDVLIETAERLAAALRIPVALGDREIFVGTSIGLVVSTPGEDEPDGLLRKADLAMYQAKMNGRGRHEAFNRHMEWRAMERLEIETDMRHALERGEFQVYYQPILSLTDGRVSETEALVRWAHPSRGLISPLDFIPTAEETGLIVPIGQWVLEQACRQARAWQDQYPDDPPRVMSVNLSGRQFQHPRLVEDIKRAVREAGIEPHTLKLEITESVIMNDADAAVAKLQALKDLGIKIAIDDFGSGYSSLSYLKRFPVDTLKIDRSFVDGLGQDPHDTAIVEAVIALAKSLNLSVTGEGVETVLQQVQLRRLRCDRGQGYLFARPVPADQLDPILSQNMANGELGLAA